MHKKNIWKKNKKDNAFLFQIITEKGAEGRESSGYKTTRNVKYINLVHTKSNH